VTRIPDLGATLWERLPERLFCREPQPRFSPNGTVHPFWRPTGSDATFAFPAGSILEPLAAHAQSLLVLDGLDFERTRGGSHEGGMEHMLTGGGGPSVDQVIAKQVGADTPFASIEWIVSTKGRFPASGGVGRS